MKKKQPFKTLIIDKKYENYDDFYGENKTNIYKTIFDVFRGFKGTRKRNLSFHLSAKIRDFEWETEFLFDRDETIVLTRDLMPYFESLEDYETCQEINNLYKELTV